MKLLLVSAVCIVLMVQYMQCQTTPSPYGDKSEGILQIIFKNVRARLLEVLQGRTYRQNFIYHLDVFVKDLTVWDLIGVLFDDGNAIKDRLRASVKVGFANTAITEQIVQAYQYLIDKGTIADVLAVFTGDDKKNLWTVWKEGLERAFKGRPEYGEIMAEFELISKGLNTINEMGKKALQDSEDEKKAAKSG